MDAGAMFLQMQELEQQHAHTVRDMTAKHQQVGSCTHQVGSVGICSAEFVMARSIIEQREVVISNVHVLLERFVCDYVGAALCDCLHG